MARRMVFHFARPAAPRKIGKIFIFLSGG